MEEKQQAKFESIIGWTDYVGHGIAAVLRNVSGHPRLGNEFTVYTSRIESIVYDENDKVKEVITSNTRYVREEA